MSKSILKCGRILELYTKLISGGSINKTIEAERFSVDKRSIQRDIEELRAFFEEQAAAGKTDKRLVYDKKENRYYLVSDNSGSLSNSEILAVCKILLESRALCNEEMKPIIEKILNSCLSRSNSGIVKALIANELLNYVEPKHKKLIVESLWDIGVAVNKQSFMDILYEKQDGTVVNRKIKPVGIMVSEFYFYLTAFIDGINKETEFDNKDDIYPTIYRIDRIKSYKVLGSHFDIPYKDRFKEGEFRKQIQFMYGGRERRIKFLYKGQSVEAVLDRLPTAKIIGKNDEGYIITANVFGDGVDMWLRSYNDNIQLIEKENHT